LSYGCDMDYQPSSRRLAAGASQVPLELGDESSNWAAMWPHSLHGCLVTASLRLIDEMIASF